MGENVIELEDPNYPVIEQINEQSYIEFYHNGMKVFIIGRAPTFIQKYYLYNAQAQIVETANDQLTLYRSLIQRFPEITDIKIVG